jgi:RNA polymerase sigma factor (sigma-70 family)
MTSQEYNSCVGKYADNIYRFILKNIKDSFTAQDVVQNAFEILWKKHKDVEFEKARSFLFTVAYNNMIDLIRKQKKHLVLEKAGDEPDPFSYDNTGVREMLEQGLNFLPADQKAVIVLRDYEGYSYQEIASITGLSAEQVKVYIYRGRKFLKSFIEKMERIP